jgi:hypothetical protein
VWRIHSARGETGSPALTNHDSYPQAPICSSCPPEASGHAAAGEAAAQSRSAAGQRGRPYPRPVCTVAAFRACPAMAGRLGGTRRFVPDAGGVPVSPVTIQGAVHGGRRAGPPAAAPPADWYLSIVVDARTFQLFDVRLSPGPPPVPPASLGPVTYLTDRRHCRDGRDITLRDCHRYAPGRIHDRNGAAPDSAVRTMPLSAEGHTRRWAAAQGALRRARRSAATRSAAAAQAGEISSSSMKLWIRPGSRRSSTSTPASRRRRA